jgi:hypothetical protein
VFTGGQDLADAILLWAIFFFLLLMQHNICYQQPLLIFKRLMLSTIVFYLCYLDFTLFESSGLTEY